MSLGAEQTESAWYPERTEFHENKTKSSICCGDIGITGAAGMIETGIPTVNRYGLSEEKSGRAFRLKSKNRP